MTRPEPPYRPRTSEMTWWVNGAEKGIDPHDLGQICEQIYTLVHQGLPGERIVKITFDGSELRMWVQ